MGKERFSKNNPWGLIKMKYFSVLSRISFCGKSNVEQLAFPFVSFFLCHSYLGTLYFSLFPSSQQLMCKIILRTASRQATSLYQGRKWLGSGRGVFSPCKSTYSVGGSRRPKKQCMTILSQVLYITFWKCQNVGSMPWVNISLLGCYQFTCKI